MENSPYSFTRQIKEEIIENTNISKDRMYALLSAFIRINGRLVIRKNNTILIMNTQLAKVAKFIYTQLNKLFDIEIELYYKSETKFKKKTNYTITVVKNADTVLEQLKISFLEGKIDKTLIDTSDEIAGYLSGAFLASGSCNSPSTSNYHLEISVNYLNYANWLKKLFPKSKANLDEPKIASRRNNFVLYFKKSNQIALFLIVIGAVNCCMDFENVRADRDLFNSLNRVSNFDTANMKKTVENATKQVEEIKLIDKKLGIDNIKNEKMKLLCKIRLDNESSSYKELASILSRQLNKTFTKSSVNHLFRSIHELYGRLSNGD